MTVGVAPDPTPTIVGFARTLQAAGVPAGPDRVLALMTALTALDPRRRSDVYWGGRLTLCAGADDLDRYDRAFAAYFTGEIPPGPRRIPAASRGGHRVTSQLAAAGEAPGTADGRVLPAAASGTELLRSRDIAALSPADREALNRLLAAFTLPGASRPSRRRIPASRGPIDAGRTLRELLHRGGEPARLRRHAATDRPRRVVLLVDVSGSMSAYADALLRFAHAATRRRATPTEVFTVGTRLTRVTRELAHRDPDVAMAAVGGVVPDWSGGTRLGELVKAFLDRWGQRGMARGAVVVILSDGWDCGEPDLLADQMARLHRLAFRVVWSNPRKSRPGYAPTAAGMAAALPHVDDFVEGHSLAALEQLAQVVAADPKSLPRSRGTFLA
jgi:uncharacterized protein with von Willebrand factor type A (vWA) domain